MDPDKKSKPENEEDGEVAVAEKENEPNEPGHYVVLLHNDHFTTMDFVVEVLRRFFHKTQEQAIEIMLQVHKDGKGVAGIFSFEIAETKVAQVTEAARQKGFPLKCTAEPI